MRESPILFNGAIVRAMLSGAKTLTRRVVRPQPIQPSFLDATDAYQPRYKKGVLRFATARGVSSLPCPFGNPGDRLWVGEAHAIFPAHGQHHGRQQ